ncbi:PAS domain-containing sensor histidine kinase [Sphingomonas sp. dw_22]|uniref:sensor histidine kinase n=1 Tax=Sphingomonas sp. dw_22 TaxID=2721175 RepID=UPI001BD214BE|nr:PAS domain-containing sensor histidine kinase [Sphingomonas sp. dw_22]
MNRKTHPDVARSLAFAIVSSSNAPALLLDEDLTVIAASTSFYRAFALDPQNVAGQPLFKLGAGEWDVPQLRSLLGATLSGQARIEAYEMDLKGDAAPRRLVLNAQKLDYGDAEQVRLLLTISDVTEARISEKLRDDLLHEKEILLQELQHRVANSLQIIASVLMQSARRVQSEETRTHLRDAHNRVMSIATVQQQLAASRLGDVELRGYFTQLCKSLGASMIHDHDRVSLDVTGDDSSVKADVSVSLGLIVTELVINALKHAFPGDRGGKILVDYRSRGEDWKLSVSDDGVGTPETLAVAKPGLGTSIVAALANQLDATVGTEGGHPGTAVSIVHTASTSYRKGALPGDINSKTDRRESSGAR